MKKPESVKGLCEFFWYLEEKFDLLNFEIEGVKPWQAHRIEIYYDLARKLNIFGSDTHRGLSINKRLLYASKMAKNAILKNTFLLLNPVKTLLFPHPRVRKIDNKYYDIYSYFLKKDLIGNGESFFEFEGQYRGKHYTECTKSCRYLDYITLMSNIRQSFISIKLENEQSTLIERVTDDIEEYLQVSYDLKNVLLSRVKKFISLYPYYKKLFEKTRPTRIFVVVAYGRAELITAAKQLGIEVIELQHGTFSQYHLGYSYPNYSNRIPEYLPDTFWVWNDFWKEMIFACNSGMKVEVYPFRFMEEEKKKFVTIKKKKNRIIVLSQTGHTEAIARKILGNPDVFEKFEIIFKLHPSEYGRLDSYTVLKLLIAKRKIELVEESDLYKLFAECEYQAGVFSTALYEGVEFGCKTILFNLPGIEYMELFIKRYKPILI